MELSKKFNNERRFSVAEYYIYLIAGEWIAAFLLILNTLFDLSLFDDQNKWLTIGLITLLLIIGVFLQSLFGRKIYFLEDKYNNIVNWKSSYYGKIAKFYTYFYIFVFPLMILLILILLD